MERIEELNARNDFRIHSVAGEEFRTYGRVWRGIPVKELIRIADRSTPIPDEGNVYVPSNPDFEAEAETEILRSAVFGGLPVQAGYCNGRNAAFNGFEYHKVPEVNIAATDFCLALGHSWEIADGLTYDVSQAEVFFVPRGTVLELFGTTLHLSPLRTEKSGFRAIIILPRGTNTPLNEAEKRAAAQAFAEGDPEARLLLQKHKWVIAHPDREPLIRQGAHAGVTGVNKELNI